MAQKKDPHFHEQERGEDRTPSLLDELGTVESVMERFLVKLENDNGMQEQDPAVMRWMAIARTHFETGLMFAEQAVTRPSGGIGRKR